MIHIISKFRQQREQLMAKFDKLEADNLKQKEEYEGKIYALEKNHIRYGSQPLDV